MFWDSDLYRRKIWYSGVLRYLRYCSYTRYSRGKLYCMGAAVLKVKCHKKVIHGTHLSYCIWFITINILNKTLPSMKTENLLGYLWESCVLWGNPRDMSRLSFKAVRSGMYHHCVLEQAKCYVNILSLITYYRPIYRRWKLNRRVKSITLSNFSQRQIKHYYSAYEKHAFKPNSLFWFDIALGLHVAACKADICQYNPLSKVDNIKGLINSLIQCSRNADVDTDCSCLPRNRLLIYGTDVPVTCT